jgi:hypothetical protein
MYSTEVKPYRAKPLRPTSNRCETTRCEQVIGAKLPGFDISINHILWRLILGTGKVNSFRKGFVINRLKRSRAANGPQIETILFYQERNEEHLQVEILAYHRTLACCIVVPRRLS